MPWYVCHTNAGRESFARDMLKERGYPVLYPHYRTIVRHARREREVERPKWPRYLLVDIEAPLSVYGVNTCPGVSTILRDARGPLILKPEALAAARAEMLDDTGLCQAPTPEERVRWKAGARVRVLRGPFEGFLATVGLDSGLAVSLWMDLFGGQTPVSMPPEWVLGAG